jgi:hypothetical protein
MSELSGAVSEAACVEMTTISGSARAPADCQRIQQSCVKAPQIHFAFTRNELILRAIAAPV